MERHLLGIARARKCPYGRAGRAQHPDGARASTIGRGTYRTIGTGIVSARVGSLGTCLRGTILGRAAVEAAILRDGRVGTGGLHPAVAFHHKVMLVQPRKRIAAGGRQPERASRDG
jgi:hypothetical protein